MSLTDGSILRRRNPALTQVQAQANGLTCFKYYIEFLLLFYHFDFLLFFPLLILSIINGVSFIISIILSFAVEKKPDCDKKKLLFGMKFVFEIQLIINFPAITEIHE